MEGGAILALTVLLAIGSGIACGFAFPLVFNIVLSVVAGLLALSSLTKAYGTESDGGGDSSLYSLFFSIACILFLSGMWVAILAF